MSLLGYLRLHWQDTEGESFDNAGPRAFENGWNLHLCIRERFLWAWVVRVILHLWGHTVPCFIVLCIVQRRFKRTLWALAYQDSQFFFSEVEVLLFWSFCKAIYLTDARLLAKWCSPQIFRSSLLSVLPFLSQSHRANLPGVSFLGCWHHTSLVPGGLSYPVCLSQCVPPPVWPRWCSHLHAPCSMSLNCAFLNEVLQISNWGPKDVDIEAKL